MKKILIGNLLLLGILFISCGKINLINPSDDMSKKIQKESNGTVNFFKHDKSINMANINATREWWKRFNDKNLNELIDYTLKNNSQILIYGYKIGQSKALLQQSESLSKPHLGYGGTYSFSRSPASVELPDLPLDNTYQLGGAGFTAGWELDLWNRLKYLQGAAAANVKASEHTLNAMKLSISSQVASTYFQLISVNRQIEHLLEVKKSLDNNLAIEESRLKEGDSNLLNYNTIVADKQATEAMLPDLYLARSQAIYALKVLQGDTSKLLKSDEKKFEKFDKYPKYFDIDKNVKLNLALSRPDVCSAEQVLIATDANWKSAKREYLPTVNLSGLGAIAAIFKTPYFFFFDLTATVTGPIYDGGYIDASIKQALSQKKQALENYKLTINSAISDIKNSLAYYDDSRLSDQLVGKEILAYKNLYDIMKEQYKVGDGNIYDLLTMQITLLLKELNLIDIQRKKLDSVVSYYKSIGGGYNYDCL